MHRPFSAIFAIPEANSMWQTRKHMPASAMQHAASHATHQTAHRKPQKNPRIYLGVRNRLTQKGRRTRKQEALFCHISNFVSTFRSAEA